MFPAVGIKVDHVRHDTDWVWRARAAWENLVSMINWGEFSVEDFAFLDTSGLKLLLATIV